MLRRLGSAAARGAAAAAQQQQQAQAGAASSAARFASSSTGGAGSSSGTSSSGTGAPAPPVGAAAAAASKLPPKIKSAEQLSPEELEQALPSMFFTTSNLVWSTLVASGVAAAGLVSMVWLGTWIVGAADSMRVPAGDAAAAKAPEKPKSLAELIAERKAELDSELLELQQLPRTPEVKARLAEVNRDLRAFRPPGPWYKVW